MSGDHEKVLADAQDIRRRTPERAIFVPAVYVDPEVEPFLKGLASRGGKGGITVYVIVAGRTMRLTLDQL